MVKSDEAEDLAANLRAAAMARGVNLSPGSQNQLVRFVCLLLLWRRRIALVSQRTARQIIAKHVEDSMAVAHLIRADSCVVDLGSGGGFPGVIIAIVCQTVSVLLVESNRRKANFLRAAVREVPLPNVKVAEVRAETLRTWSGYTGPFDVVVSRAVWSLNEFLDVASPLVRNGGMAVAMKTPGAPDIARAAGQSASCEVSSGFSDAQTEEYALRGGERRAIVVWRKCST